LNSQTYNYFILYNIFGFLWTYAFVTGIGFLVIAGTVSRWYFEADKKMLFAPLLKSMKTAIRYHMGSVAFGSLILAIVQVIRIVFNYIANKSEKAKDNPVVKLMICCINCMLSCLERFVKFLNTNASVIFFPFAFAMFTCSCIVCRYIMVAMNGTSFCTSAKDALKLIISNLGLIAAAGVIQDIVLFIGQWTITGGTVACCWIYLNAVASDPTLLPANVRSVSGVATSFPVFTFILIVIISYCIGCVFMEVFGQIIDTLLLCFCEDSENVRCCFMLFTCCYIMQSFSNFDHF
jgi:choline transporter-like protein 2/4/5